MSQICSSFVEESRFGNWFLKTNTWKVHVLQRALNDLQAYLPVDYGPYTQVLDVGCGFGHSFSVLAQHFSPDVIVGLDIAPDLAVRAGEAAERCLCQVNLHCANAASMDLPDAQFDLVFCHQTFHHIVEQEAAMAEFFRVLKPGGVLLLSESTRRYIHSLPIKLLFRHPMHVQKTAKEYISMIHSVGFDLPDTRVGTPYIWWSRPDIGFFEWIGLSALHMKNAQREPTLINAVAVKPKNRSDIFAA
ncbi:MAG: class I SAM-dependent methyltransferase [Ottowia sp.]|nr:class I SAM-dependent methyltransferase [Ottowia sp.]